MISGIKFIFLYSFISIVFFILSKFPFNLITMEIFSYLLWYYLYTLIIGILIFPILSWLILKNNFSLKWRIILSICACLIFINCVPFFNDNGRILTFDIAKGIFTNNHSCFGFNTVGVHLIASVSFLLAYLLLRKDRFWSNSSYSNSPSTGASVSEG